MTDRNAFKAMWESMQKDGYFSDHAHYTDYHGAELSESDKSLDADIMSLDYAVADITMPAPYSEELERAAKRTEPFWLYQMFDLPKTGMAYDIGCGFGRSVEWLSDIYDHVYASDVSGKVIEEAKKNLASKTNVSLYVNDADSLPGEIPTDSLQFAYAFTVFQHIPREFAQNLLRQLQPLLAEDGCVVFNLLSGVNEDMNEGEDLTEWAIGYSRKQAADLVAAANLELIDIKRWSRPGHEFCWLWVLARRSKLLR